VELVGDAELEARAPRREAIVDVALADGTQLSEHVEAVRGTSDNPMPRAEVVAKCRDLIMPVLGAAKSAALIERVLALDSVTNVRDLHDLLQARG
jgi:2-methylcitrate dehydratase PrpD